MQTKSKKLFVFSIAILAATFAIAQAQESQTRLATANGSGSIKVGTEEFKITSVVVKLLADNKAEITLVADIAFFLSGTWSGGDDPQKGIDLQINGGASPGGLEASGKVFLSEDGKSVSRLNLKGTSRTTKKVIEANFQARQ